MNKEPSIFISHNAADKEFARQIAIDLNLAGARVWFDEAEIKLGDSLIEKIREGIDSVDYLAVIISPNSVQSNWVSKEVDIAMNQEIKGKKVKVLPLLYKECDLPGFLEGKLYADFRDTGKYNDSLLLIIDRLGLAKPLDQENSPKRIEKQQLPEVYKRPYLLALLVFAAVLLVSFFDHGSFSFLPDGTWFTFYLLPAVSYTLPSTLTSWERFVLATLMLASLEYSRYEIFFPSDWSFILKMVTGIIISWAWCSFERYSRAIGSFFGFLAGSYVASSIQQTISRYPEFYQSNLHELFAQGFFLLFIWAGIIAGDLIVVNKSHTIQTIYKTHRLEKR